MPLLMDLLTALDPDAAPAEEDDAYAWQKGALCAQTDPESFFPEKGSSTADAKRTCASCPVVADCLQSALDNDERFGVWGGYSERERRKIKQMPAGERAELMERLQARGEAIDAANRRVPVEHAAA